MGLPVGIPGMPGPAPVRHWRALWISDVHLGCKYARVDALLDFLRRNHSRSLYLVGDFIDGWELRRGWHWDQRVNTVIQKILRQSRKGTRVTYVTGNHDEFLEPYTGLRFGTVRLVREAIHRAADGRRYLVVHGHQFDGLTSMNRLLERVGARIYDWVLGLNHMVNRLRSRLGLKHWSLAASLKGSTKAAIRYITEYEDALARLAERRGVDGVICGHIHRAEIARIGSLAYLNCGDWVESCTALAEDAGGNFHLITHHENPADGSGRGSGSSDAGHRGVGDAIAIGA
jgi:UDP-2,3-diacylglucosamine pyrophosphatase LpxH